jgi:ATP-dependent DNA ligase
VGGDEVLGKDCGVAACGVRSVSGLQSDAARSRKYDDAAACSSSGKMTRQGSPIGDDSTRPSATTQPSSFRGISPTGRLAEVQSTSRSICFRDGDQVELGSRNERPMTRYFPELVAAVKAELPQRCVIDGEIIIATNHGLDFEALQQRIHPAESRVRMLAEQTPAAFVAFDLLALGHDDYTGRPFSERRAALVDALAGSGPSIHVTPATTDLATAQRWFDEFEGAGLDGIIAKPLTITYQSDKRVMFKIKHERTADCVVAGYRTHKTDANAIGSLLLGLYKDDGTLASVGVIGAFPMATRRRLFTELQSLVTTFEQHPWNWAAHMAGDRTPRRNEGSRWNAGKDLSFVPLRPERVVEVRYDHMEGERFRHTAQFNRWRPDRDPRSCTYAQLEQPVTFSLSDIVPGLRIATSR